MLLVSPFLLLITLILGNGRQGFAIDNLGSGSTLGLIAWLIVVGLGSIGAFPSASDPMPIRGVLTLIAMVALAGIVAWAIFGLPALDGLERLAIVWLAVPALEAENESFLRVARQGGGPASRSRSGAAADVGRLTRSKGGRVQAAMRQAGGASLAGRSPIRSLLRPPEGPLFV